MTTASNVAIIFFDLIDEALISSFEDRRVTRSMAIRAPPTPPLRTVVIEIALVEALDANDDAAITKVMMFVISN
jgi:hypothetical protein